MHARSGGIAPGGKDRGGVQVCQAKIRPDLQRGFELTKSFIHSIQPHQCNCVVDERIRVFGIAPGGPFEIPGRFTEVALRGEHMPEIALG